MTWPAHKLGKTRPGDRRKLADWLVEWDLDRILRPSDASARLDGADGISGMKAAYPLSGMYEKEDIQSGDIRLLRPSVAEPQDARPLYMVVLPGSVPDALCWVPFGRFAVPALPEEWRTGLQHTALRVLCFWNAQQTGQGRGPRSWRVKRLSERQLVSWMEVRQMVEDGKPVSTRLENRLGPPLRHPADPRHMYMEEERERVCAAFPGGRANELTMSEEQGLYLTEWRSDPIEWLMAAESREKYGVAAVIYVTTDSTVIVAVYEQERDVIRIRIMDRDGFPCDRFDGGYVQAAGGDSSSRIKDGKADAASGLAETLRVLVDREGRRTPLRRKYRETPKS